METANTGRRNFLKMGSAALATGVVLITLRSSRALAAAGDINADIGFNHGHSFTMTLEQIVTNGPTTYNIQGASSHPHTLLVDAGAIAALQGGQAIEIISSKDKGHEHVVTLQVL